MVLTAIQPWFNQQTHIHCSGPPFIYSCTLTVSTLWKLKSTLVSMDLCPRSWQPGPNFMTNYKGILHLCKHFTVYGKGPFKIVNVKNYILQNCFNTPPSPNLNFIKLNGLYYSLQKVCTLHWRTKLCLSFWLVFSMAFSWLKETNFPFHSYIRYEIYNLGHLNIFFFDFELVISLDYPTIAKKK